MSENETTAAACVDLQEKLMRNSINISLLSIHAPLIDRRPEVRLANDPATFMAKGNRLYKTLSLLQKDAVCTIVAALNNRIAQKLLCINCPSSSGKTWAYT